jgi:pyrroloquinoline quinone (PQQ) biosynthesis protein C
MLETSTKPAEPRISGLPSHGHARLRHSTFSDHGVEDAAVMSVGRKYLEITGKSLTREQFMSITRYLDGRHSINDIGALTGLGPEVVTKVVELLAARGALAAGEPDDMIPVQEFVTVINGVCQSWGRQLGQHPLFQGLADLSLRKEVFIGLFIETYHYVSSAPRHIATAISSCRDKAYASLLAEYFVEEYNHAGLLAETLERLGLDRAALENSYPASGTVSLVTMLCEIARTDTLAYWASTSLMEARADQVETSSAKMREVCQAYGWPTEALDPFISHAAADVEAGHSNLLSLALSTTPAIPAAHAHAAVNSVHDLKHAFHIFFDQILSYYSNISNHIPRQAVGFSVV